MARDIPFITAPNFAGRLQVGERVVWQGTPNPAQFNRLRIFVYALILLPLMPLFVWAISRKIGVSLALLSPLNAAISLALWPFACWLMSCHVGEQTPWAAYALTDRRVMIRRLERLTSQNTRPKIEEYPLGALKPCLRQGKDGIGTITFGFRPWEYEQAFRAIPDATNVFALLTEARRALLPSQDDTPYYRKPSHISVPAPTVETYLQRGETILWQGRPDPEAWWRTHRMAVLVLHLLIAAAIGTFLEATGRWTPSGQALAFVPALALYPLWKAGIMRKVHRTDYVATSRRVLVLKGRGPRTLEERSLAETAEMRLVKEKNGIGTIVFEKHSHWVWHRHGSHKETYEYSFQHITDAQIVFSKIMAARTTCLSSSC